METAEFKLSRFDTMKYFLTLFEVLKVEDGAEFIIHNSHGNPYFNSTFIKFLSNQTTPQHIDHFKERTNQLEGTAELFISILDTINKITDDCGLSSVHAEISDKSIGHLKINTIEITIVGIKT